MEAKKRGIELERRGSCQEREKERERGVKRERERR